MAIHSAAAAAADEISKVNQGRPDSLAAAAAAADGMEVHFPIVPFSFSFTVAISRENLLERPYF
jgi:hypothetical protein